MSKRKLIVPLAGVVHWWCCPFPSGCAEPLPNRVLRCRCETKVRRAPKTNSKTKFQLPLCLTSTGWFPLAIRQLSSPGKTRSFPISSALLSISSCYFRGAEFGIDSLQSDSWDRPGLTSYRPGSSAAAQFLSHRKPSSPSRPVIRPTRLLFHR